MAVALMLVSSPMVPTPVQAAYEYCANRLVLTNYGPHAVSSVYMRPTGGYWGGDLLGSDYLFAYEYFHPLYGLSLGDSVQDFYVVYSDGYVITATYDVCATPSVWFRH